MTNKFETAALQEVSGRRLLLNVELNQQDSSQWIEENAKALDNLISQNGAVLLRGLKISNAKQYAHILQTVFGEALSSYTYRSTPRTQLRGNIYTATEYLETETIPQHNEKAYANKWPMRLGLFCMHPATEGGETPLADSRLIYQMLPDDIKQKFIEKGVKYVRNYGDIDLPWQEVFQTDDKAEVETFCRDNALEFKWNSDGTLTTSQVNPAVAEHPVTGEKVWFNQAHLFHVSSLPKETQEHLLSTYKEEALPRNSYYGDGSPLEPEVLEQIKRAYEQVTFKFSWQKHDLLLVDNMLYTHGRKPYSGKRKVLVGMTRTHSH
ncbi:MAG: TauD/TfdA family dioxygenase [Algicola sp.]|nr:TauD/TfdA family dioxygenase [Algicola sp.]